jgi:hypothetical protein
MIRDWQRIRAQLYRHRDGTFIYGKSVVGGGSDWFIVYSDGIRLQPPFDTYGEARTWYDNQRESRQTVFGPEITRDVLRVDGPGWSKVKP